MIWSDARPKIQPGIEVNALADLVSDHLERPLYATVGGPHLYGFPAKAETIQLKGAHLASKREQIGLFPCENHKNKWWYRDGHRVELTSFEVSYSMRMVLRNMPEMLEQIFAPQIVYGTDFLTELRPLATDCITSSVYQSYKKSFEAQTRKLAKQRVPNPIGVLHAYRYLFTGIHLLQTGEVESNLYFLNDIFRSGIVNNLLQRVSGGEQDIRVKWRYHCLQFDRLEGQMYKAYRKTKLPTEWDRHKVDDHFVEIMMNCEG